MQIENVHYTLILSLFTSLTSLAQESENWRSNFDTIDFTELQFQNMPLVTTPEQVKKVLGEPDKISVSSYPEKLTIEEVRNLPDTSQSKARGFYFYDSIIGYTIKGNKAWLSSIHFENDTLVLYHPELTFSSQTSLNDFKKAFPQSYKSKNFGLSMGMGSDLNKEEFEENFSFYRLLDESTDGHREIVLGFYKNKLIEIVIDGNPM